MSWDMITIYTVKEMADEEGRRWNTIGTYNSEQDAKDAKGNSNYRRVDVKTVYLNGPLKGADVKSVRALPRLPVDAVMKDAEIEKGIRRKLTPSEWEWFSKRIKS